MKYKSVIEQLKLSIPLIFVALIIILFLIFYYFRTVYGNSDRPDHTDIGIDLTSLDDVKTMRADMTDLAVRTVKYIRNNYSTKLTDIAKVVWKYRGNSDQWTMAIATDDVDGFKKGDIMWSGDPGLLCSGNIPFCNIATKYLEVIQKDPDNKNISFADLKINRNDLAITTDTTINGATWIVAYQTLRTKNGRWIKRSEGYVYQMRDRRLLLFVFGVYDYTGILYDFDEEFQEGLIKAFGLKNN